MRRLIPGRGSNSPDLHPRHHYGLLHPFSHRHLLLLGVLFGFLVALPVIEHGHVAPQLTTLLFTLVVVPTVYATGRNARWIVLGIGLAAPAIVVALWSLLWPPTNAGVTRTLLNVHLLSMVAFLGFTFIAMTFHLARARAVDEEILASAVGVYMVVGFLFAAIYQLQWLLSGPCVEGMTLVRGVVPPLSEFVYFSLMTQTTVGFGDMFPSTPTARSLTNIQAVMGQMYLVVLLARLVGLYAVTSYQERP